MAEFTEPRAGVHVSFLAAMAELRAEGRGKPGDDTMIGREILTYGDRWSQAPAFCEYIGWLRAQALEETPRPAGYVPATTLWWVSGDEYLGRLAIRHRLTPRLQDAGGHIGYDVRPSARRRGHATTMLAAALPVARGLGIDRALVTCDVGNTGSQKVIEANGGVMDYQRGGIPRYWVPTS
jgi:predicted acetyltransferase